MKMKGIIAGVITLALLLVASPAQADVVGGGGTAPGGALQAGGMAPTNWDRVVGIWDPTGAYDDFLAAAQGNGNYAGLNSAAKVQTQLSNMGILSQCQSARLIIYLRDENFGVWMYSTGAGFGITGEVSHGSGWTSTPGNGYVYIQNRNDAGQPGWGDAWTTSSGQSISPQNEVMAYAASAPHNTTVICAWGSNYPTTSTSYSRNQATVTDSDTWTEPYSWSTSVQREISQNGIDPIGVNNLQDQPAVTTNSAFSSVYDSLASSSAETETVDAKRTRINAALATDASKVHSNVTLNASNQAGLAEGGVLSVYEHTTYASISASQSTTWQRCNQVTNERYWTGSAYAVRALVSGPIAWNPSVCASAPLVGGSPTYVATDTTAAGFPTTATNWGALATSYTNTKTLSTAQNTGFWQILSVHCNPTELAALLSSISGEQIVSQTAGVNGSSTTVLYTQKYDSRAAAIAAGGILGTTLASLPTAVQRTGALGFYDKECTLACISNPTTATGASSANGATTNQGITTNQGGKNYKGGVLYNGDVNSNYLEIFRDNNDRTISVNTAYPSNADPQFKYGGTYANAATGSGTVAIPAAAPVSTTVTRWSQGTPGSATNNGGQFSMLTKTGIALFQGTDSAPTPQLDFATNPYQSLNSTTLNGFYRDFIVKATWASEVNQPQVLNFKWEYKPTVWTTFPSTIGFAGASSNAASVSAYTVKDQPIDGRCYAQFGSYTNNLDLSSRVQASTGTGTTNTLDNGMLESVSGDNSWQTQSNLVLKFVRAVSE